MTKPCEAPCPKCGSTDVYRLHKTKGERWRKAWTYGDRVTEFATDNGLETVATAEHIHHHCRICHYEWGTETL